MNKRTEIEIKVGFFVTVGAALIMIGLIVLGGGQSFFSSHAKYIAHFESAGELIPGSKVVLNGIRVGVVDSVRFDDDLKRVRVDLKIDKKFVPRIRQTAQIEITTQGVLGDKYVAVTGGAMEDPELPIGSEIQTKASQDLSKFLSSGEQLVSSMSVIANSVQRILGSFEKDQRSDLFFKGLSLTAKNLSSLSQKVDQELDNIPIKSSLRQLEAILKKVNDGKGTLGALINDPAMYDDAKSLLGGINRNRVMRNLVRQTIKGGEVPSVSDTPENIKK